MIIAKKKKRFFIECQIFKLADKKKSQVSNVRSRERFINMIRIAYFILRDRQTKRKNLQKDREKKDKHTKNSSGFGLEFGLTPGQTRRIGESETK